MPTKVDVVGAVQSRTVFEGMTVREINEDTRTATFVFATEQPVMTYAGLEVLRMSGVEFGRFKKNPVVLDTHNRWDIASIIGRVVSVSVEGRELVGDVTFAETERGEVAWQLVSTGFLRTTSVGYIPTKVVDLEDGKKDGTGENQVIGPARVVKKWQLLEISLVPLPADEDALLQGVGEGVISVAQARNFMERLQAVIDEQEERMKKEGKKISEPEKDKEKAAVPSETRTENPAPPAETPTEDEKPPESERKAAIYDITPRGLEEVAERCLIEGKTVEETREVLLKEHTERCKPAGTPEAPKPGQKGEEKKEEPQKMDDVDDKTLTRGLTG